MSNLDLLVGVLETRGHDNRQFTLFLVAYVFSNIDCGVILSCDTDGKLKIASNLIIVITTLRVRKGHPLMQKRMILLEIYPWYVEITEAYNGIFEEPFVKDTYRYISLLNFLFFLWKDIKKSKLTTFLGSKKICSFHKHKTLAPPIPFFADVYFFFPKTSTSINGSIVCPGCVLNWHAYSMNT